MSFDTWAGILISIPVSIGSALLVPKIQMWLNKQGEKSHAKRHERIQQEYSEVLYYAIHTDLLLGKMVSAAIQLLLLVLVVLTLNWMHPVAQDIFDMLFSKHLSVSKHFAFILAIVLLSSTVVGATAWIASIFKWSSRYIALLSNVASIKAYVKNIPEEIRDREFENVVIYAARERALPADALMRLFHESQAKTEEQAETEKTSPNAPDTAATVASGDGTGQLSDS